ncbi:MAG: acyltransferase [Candidatus Sericytochromatia bacterium]|nr:acyltransferase [Candidatus Sericytochromatia bacterium]
MTTSLPIRLLSTLGRWDERLVHWRSRSQRALLLRRHPGLRLPDSVKVEAGVLWRLAPNTEVSFGAGSVLRRGCEFKADPGSRIQVGQNVHIGPWCTISALHGVEIGDDCLIAEGVSIRDHDHAFSPEGTPYRAQGYRLAAVHIGRNVWLGSGVTIVKGVSLGEGSVVAAGAVVTRSYPPGSLIGGVPARLLRPLLEVSPPGEVD